MSLGIAWSWWSLFLLSSTVFTSRLTSYGTAMPVSFIDLLTCPIIHFYLFCNILPSHSCIISQSNYPNSFISCCLPPLEIFSKVCFSGPSCFHYCCCSGVTWRHHSCGHPGRVCNAITSFPVDAGYPRVLYIHMHAWELAGYSFHNPHAPREERDSPALQIRTYRLVNAVA